MFLVYIKYINYRIRKVNKAIYAVPIYEFENLFMIFWFVYTKICG